MKSIITIIMLSAIMAAPSSNSIHQFTMTSLEGEDVSLEKFKGKALLIVNVQASVA